MRSCYSGGVAGVHCIPMMATQLSVSGARDYAIVSLTIALAVVLFILIVMIAYNHRGRFVNLKLKVNSLIHFKR